MRIKVRPLARTPEVPRSLLDDRLARCCQLVDDYLRARAQKDINALLNARHHISLMVLPGAYRLGGDASDDLFVVSGVRETRVPTREEMSVGSTVRQLRSTIAREDAFEVPYTKILRDGNFEGVWHRPPLIGIEGFLMPVCSDEYSGQRFIRVGELIHV